MSLKCSINASDWFFIWILDLVNLMFLMSEPSNVILLLFDLQVRLYQMRYCFSALVIFGLLYTIV